MKRTSISEKTPKKKTPDDTKRVPVWKGACAACGAAGVPLYNVVGLALCGDCRDHYGPTLEEEYRRDGEARI